MNDSSWTDVFGLTDKSNVGRLKLILGAIAVIAAFAAVTTSSGAAGVFAPTVTFQTSTTRASSHPDLRITIDNSASDQSIGAMLIRLPNGFMGSLASATKCTGNPADPDDPDFGNCPANSKIGSVVNEAIIDQSEVRIQGDVYLADAAPDFASTDPAGIIIKVHPQVGAVQFEDVILAARVKARYGPTGPGSAANAVGPIQGIDTTVSDIPNTVDDDDGVYDPVTFVIKKVILDLKSRFDNFPATPPLLTNPSVCVTAPTGPTAATSTTGQVVASFTSSDASETASDNDPFETTGCGNPSNGAGNTVKFAPTFSTTLSNPTPGQATSLSASIQFPTDNGSGNGTLKTVSVLLPPIFAPHAPGYGFNSDQCPSSSAPLTTSSFDRSACPANSLVGTATIDTPLLPQPVEGNVYLINQSPIPNLGIWADSSTDPDIPAGITLSLLGTTSVPNLTSTCVTGTDNSCQARIQAVFRSMPDAPVRSAVLDLTPPAPRSNGNGPIDDKFLAIGPTTDLVCQKLDHFVGTFTGNASDNANTRVSRLTPLSLPACDAQDVTPTGGPFGTAVSSPNPPTFTFTGTAADCSIDSPTLFDDYASPPTFEACGSGTYTPAAAKTVGPHRVYIGTSGAGRALTDAFVIAPASTSSDDTTLPTTAIDNGPAEGSTSTTATPSFEFSSSESNSTFDCAVDDGAFLPCTSPYTTPELTTGNADDERTHTFEVRATDPMGNLDLTSAKRTFKVDVPFDPQITVTPSTTTARQHPDLDVKITTGSHTDIKNLTLAMPDGFFGGLTGVSAICSIAQADVVQDDPDAPVENQPIVDGPSNCPAASKVGTVTVTGEITDPSGLVPTDAVLSGDIFLTDGRGFSEPAGILIQIHAKIDTVDMGYIKVPVHLELRDHALGIDSMAFDVPNSITSVDGTTEFDTREMKLHLNSNSGGSQPLLVNPSSCAPAAFRADFTSYDQPGASSSSDSSPFQVTGCSSLPFAPQLGADVKDVLFGTPPGPSTDGRSVSATMTATLAADPNGAGITAVSALLPKPLTINILKLPKTCQQAEYDGPGCPADTIVGQASATSPLLNEPITGNIYLLKAVSPNVTPRLLLALRGRINTDIIAVNSFEPGTGTQIRTSFSTLPDVPITSFTLSVANVVSTLIEACETPASGWNITGTMLAHNGATSAINSPLKFACNRVAYKYKSFSNRKNKSKFTLTTAAQGEIADMKSLKLQAPKGMAFNAKGIKRKLKITADGKKVSAKKCVKVSGKKKNVLTINCKRKVRTLVLAFGAGSLNVARKVNRRAYLTATPSLVSGKAAKSKLKLFTEAFERTPTTP